MMQYDRMFLKISERKPVKIKTISLKRRKKKDYRVRFVEILFYISGAVIIMGKIGTALLFK